MREVRKSEKQIGEREHCRGGLKTGCSVGFIRPFLREKKAWNNRKKGECGPSCAKTKTIFYAYTKILQIQPKKLLCFYTSQTHHHFNQSLY